MGDLQSSEPKFVTFYSYTGGVGRTSALANVAFRLATTHGLRVAVIDWDLEAPALDRFFRYAGKSTPEERARQIRDLNTYRGVVDCLIDWQNHHRKRSSSKDADLGAIGPNLHTIDLTKVDLARSNPQGKSGHLNAALRLVTAGRRDDGSYVKRLAAVDWQELPSPAELFRAATKDEQIVLLDSRTGLTDITALCTIAFPDGVVMMTVANESSWDGIQSLAKTVRNARKDLTMWLAVSRVPLIGEVKLTEEWFEKHALGDAWSTEQHPDELATFRIPHSGRWTIGQQMVWNDGREDYLPRAYDILADALATWWRRDTVSAWASGEACETLDDAIEHAERRGDLSLLAQLFFVRGHCHAKKSGTRTQAVGDFNKSAYLALGHGDCELRVMSAYRLELLQSPLSRETSAELACRSFGELRDRSIASRIAQYGKRTGLESAGPLFFGSCEEKSNP